jgi:predicted dehydrogenase
VIGVALLGAGFMGRAHAAAYAALEDRARVVVVCARGAGAAELADRLGAPLVADVESAMAVAGVDAVDVCLPTPMHRTVAERALATGRHVLLEKPLALSLEDADAIGAAARANGRVLMVGHVLRFFPEMREIAAIVSTGELGRPVSASALRLSPPPDWNMWMLDPAQSGGVAVDLMIHDLDLLLGFLGPARSVTARAADARHVAALVEHANGDAVVEASHAMPASFPFTARLRLQCEHGVIDHAFRAEPAAEGGNIGGGASSYVRVHAADGEARTLPVAVEDPWTAEVAHFLDCVADGVEPRFGGFADARAALVLALAVRRSVELAEPVLVPANGGL